MSFRLVHSSRLVFQPNHFRQLPRQYIHFSSSTPSNENDNNKSIKKEKPQEDSPVQKTIAVTKAYLEKAQSDIKPRLEPYINKINHCSEQLKKLTSDVSDSKEALRRASRALNELTGYDQIDAVKQKVNDQAHFFETTRDKVQEAKRNYENAIETRSNTQRGINELLQRKHLWTGDDVTKFTELYRLEHSHSQAELIAKETYQASEKQMDREYMELARSIMERYHEEQLWSDKIRSVSTYGTWALMVVNLMLFVAVQTIFEPRKRKRLTDRFEELLVAKVDEEEEKFKHVFESLDEKDRLLMQQQVAVMETLNSLAEHPLFDQETLHSLKVSAQQRDMFPVPVTPTLPDIPTESSSTMDSVTAPLVNDFEQKMEGIQLSNEELSRLLLSTPSGIIDKASLDEENKLLNENNTTPISKETIHKPIFLENTDTLTLSKRDFVMYSIESALAGGLVTALAVYFFS